MGALTLKSFADELREWEFLEGEVFDPTTSFGTNLRVSIRENQIFLVEPLDLFMPWITDKGRLFFDGMFKNFSKKITKWKKFFFNLSELIYFNDHLNKFKLNCFYFLIIFDNLSLESLNILYLLQQKFSFITIRKLNNYKINNDLEFTQQLNDSIQKSKLQISTLCLLLNINPRYEGYVLNLNLRQRVLKGNFKILSIGPILNLTFLTYNLGSNINNFKIICEGTHLTCQDIKKSEFPLFISNTELFKRYDTKNLFKFLNYTNFKTISWKGFNILQHNISNLGIDLLNFFLPLTSKDLTNFFSLYFINSSLISSSNFKKLIELNLLNIKTKKNTFNKTIVINQINDFNLNKNILNNIKINLKIFNKYYYLPNNLFLEDNETFINTEGLIKRATKLLHFKKNAKNNWQIIRKVYFNFNKIKFLNNIKDNKLIYFNCSNIHNFKNYINFQFYSSQILTNFSFYLFNKNKANFQFFFNSLKLPKIKFLNTKLKLYLDDFFLNSYTDLFSYNSSILTTCSKNIRLSHTNFF